MSFDTSRQPLKRSGDMPSTSCSLLENAKTNDPRAWQHLVELYGPAVYRWCRKSGLQAEDAKDVFQEVFVAVATHLADFRREGPADSFRGWLRTITRNKVRDFYRRRSNLSEAEGGSVAQMRLQQVEANLLDDGDPSAEASDTTRLIHHAAQLTRNEFENHTWDMFWRAAVAGDKPADIAAESGVSVSAVYQAKSRVLRRLRQQLKGLFE